MGGNPVGYAASTIDTTPTTITVQNNTVLDIAALGASQRVGSVSQFTLTRTMQLISFDASLTSEAARFRAAGRVQGDTVLEVTIEAGGRPQAQRIRLSRPLVMTELVNLQLAVTGGLRVGRSFSVQSFNPLTMEQSEVRLTVLAESTFVVPDSAVLDSATGRWVPAHYDTVPGFKLSQSVAGTTFEAWIDGAGGIIEASSEIGISFRRTAFEIAVQNYRLDREAGRAVPAGAGSDIISRTAIASNARLEPEALRVLRVRLENVSLEGFNLSGGRQRLAGDTLTITRESGIGHRESGPPPPLHSARVPLNSGGDTAIANAMQPEPLVQSDDPRIAAQARQIVGRERRAGEVARLLTDWVYARVEKKITVSVPSAMQVLESLEGDCNEHTVLYVALARALGLPARTAAGVVYLRGTFYYHAWPEVWLGAWVAVDPTFGQYPADAAHIRFVIGGLARQVELIRLIGRLRLNVVDSE